MDTHPDVIEKPEAGAAADPSRRRFMTRLGQAGVLAAAGSPLLSAEVLAQAPAAAPPADPPGTVPNAAVLAEKGAAFKVHTERPLTGSVTAEFLDDQVTPNNLFYVRNNLLTPDLDAATHRLKITGLVDKELEFSVADLKKLPGVSVQGMVECAGSGRTAFQPTPRGTPWPVTGGMGCPKWDGVPLRTLLERAGIKGNAVHVAFIGADFGAVATAPPMIRSIPLDKAMEPNTLVAWGMNGQPLPKVHGYPLRSMVPGWAGSASGKWLKEIRVLDAPFQGSYMDKSYRIPPHPIAPGEKMPPGALMAEAWPIKSIITMPSPNSNATAGNRVVIRGKAWAGDNAVRRVEISLDEGVTWERAVLDAPGDKYAWRTFKFEFIPQKVGHLTILARATDDQGNTQPIVAPWNPLGYYWNGLHRVGINVAKA